MGLTHGPPPPPQDFSISCGPNYPTESPKVLAKTTSNGAVRFNPNIYAWRGEACENWSAVHGLLSLCVSIQSLMSDKPYLNEPGFENSKDNVAIEKYNQKITHETLRVSICDRFEQLLDMTPDASRKAWFCRCSQASPFADQMKLMFLWYYSIYMKTTETASQKVKVGQKFDVTRFEHSGNTMIGTFDYPALQARLTQIHERIMAESAEWIGMSRKSIDDQLLIVGNLTAQFSQIQTSKEFESDMSIELVDDNPFHWRVVIFGPRGTSYEDGLFEATMVFHPNFPTVPPRIRFQTNIFHVHVAPTGYVYYKVSKAGEVRQYLSALKLLLEDEPSTAPATHLNVDAAQLYFGDETQRRTYNRNARRSAQRSLD
nr:hypothetical protein HK105_003368 [Polyrhizophydium stewartii]